MLQISGNLFCVIFWRYQWVKHTIPWSNFWNAQSAISQILILCQKNQSVPLIWSNIEFDCPKIGLVQLIQLYRTYVSVFDSTTDSGTSTLQHLFSTFRWTKCGPLTCKNICKGILKPLGIHYFSPRLAVCDLFKGKGTFRKWKVWLAHDSKHKNLNFNLIFAYFNKIYQTGAGLLEILGFLWDICEIFVRYL